MKTNPGQLLKATLREVKQLILNKNYREALNLLEKQNLEKAYPRLDHSETKMLYSDALAGLGRYQDALNKLYSGSPRLWCE